MKRLLNRSIKLLKTIVSVLLLVMVIASFPSLLSLGRPSNIQYYSEVNDPDFKGNLLYKLHFHPEKLWRKPFLYFRQLKAGEIFIYKEGKTTRNFLEEIPRYFSLSFRYLLAAGIISIAAGLSISVYMADRKRNPVLYEALSFITVVPDFILIILIQFLFLYINKMLGVNLVRLHTLSSSSRALLLPLSIMSIYPVLYIVRTLSGQIKDIHGQTFILYARAKGLSNMHIRLFHLGPAALHLIKGDLHKILAILFTNLFISERMFNNSGITSFLFNNISEYNCTVNTIIAMLLMYLLLYAALNLLLFIGNLILRRSLP